MAWISWQLLKRKHFDETKREKLIFMTLHSPRWLERFDKDDAKGQRMNTIEKSYLY